MGDVLLFVVTLTGWALVAAGEIADVRTTPRRAYRWPMTMITAGWAVVFLRTVFAADAPLWLRLVLGFMVLININTWRRRPPSNRSKRLAAKVRGYKARAALTRLGVATARS